MAVLAESGTVVGTQSIGPRFRAAAPEVLRPAADLVRAVEVLPAVAGCCWPAVVPAANTGPDSGLAASMATVLLRATNYSAMKQTNKHTN